MLLVFASCSREFLVVKSVLARFYVGGPSEERLNDYASGRVAWLDYEHCLYMELVLKVHSSRVCHLWHLQVVLLVIKGSSSP